MSNHQIAMHLEGDMTVVRNLTVSNHLSQLEINYVTSISREDQTQEQIVHNFERVKYETVQIKPEYHSLQERLNVEEPQHVLENNVSINISCKKTRERNTISGSCDINKK